MSLTRLFSTLHAVYRARKLIAIVFDFFFIIIVIPKLPSDYILYRLNFNHTPKSFIPDIIEYYD